MSDTWSPPSPSAFDTTPWPTALLARAVERADGHARIHGYDVVHDLVPHYRHSDVVYLAIVGELPSDARSWLFHVAATSVSTVSINEAPAHVGHLARLTGGAVASIIAATALTAADNAARIVAEQEPVRAWLDAGANGDPPVPGSASDPSEHGYAESLVAVARRAAEVPVALGRSTRRAAEVGLMHIAGVTRRDHLEAAMAWAMASGAFAEALTTKAQEFNRYPALLPPFHYVNEGATR